MSAIAKSCGAAAALVAGVCVAAPGHQSNEAFLCSPGQTAGLPGAYDANRARDTLLAEGYTNPVAVAGNVRDGDNLGAYTLTCDTDGVPTGKFVDQNGTVVTVRYAPTGVYAVVGSAG